MEAREIRARPRRRCRVAPLVGVALAASIAPSRAAAIAGDTDDVIGLDGSLRTITAFTRNYRVDGLDDLVDRPESDGQSQTSLRLVLQGYPTEGLRYEVHGVQDLTMVTEGADIGGLATSATAPVRYRRDADYHWLDEDRLDATLRLDRANLRFALPALDVTVGRQAVTFGKAHFWNPLDVFFPFDPWSFDRDYKPGVDALRLDVPLGDFSGLTLLEVLGHGDADDLPYDSAVLMRVFTNQWDWDFALQGGKVYGGYHVGASTSGEVSIDEFGIEARAEAAYFAADNDGLPSNAIVLPSAFTGVAGLGHLFEPDVLVSAEYLYNGMARRGLGDAFDLLGRGIVTNASEHVAGVLVTYQLTALVTTSAATMISLSDSSVLLQPGVVYSAADDVELLAGALVAFGDRPVFDPGSSRLLRFESEFGTYPHVFYTELKAYF